MAGPLIAEREKQEETRAHLQARMRALLSDFAEDLSPLDLADAARDSLDEISTGNARYQSATARAILRGYAEKENLKNLEGGHVSADEARAFLKLSKPAVLERYKKGRLLGWREKNAVRFPIWQFAPDGGLHPGVEDALAALNQSDSYDDWARILFFLNPRRSLGGKRPLDLLREGRGAEVVRLAGMDE